VTRVYVRPGPLPDVLGEHVEEGAFLYGARRRCFVDGRFAWTDAQTREQRLDAHLHAIGLGGRASAKFLQEKLVLKKDDDAGESFVAAAVLPRLGFVEPMELLMEALAARPPNFRALVDGLCYAATPDLEPWVLDFLESGSPIVRAVGAELLASLGSVGVEERLTRLLQDPDPGVKLSAAAALSSRGKAIDIRPLVPLLEGQEPAISFRAARLLLAAGDDFTLDWLRRRITAADPVVAGEAALLLAIAGNLQDVPAIQAVSRAHAVQAPSLLEALGRAGSVSVMDDLLNAIGRPDPSATKRFAAAWNALGTLSGRHRPPQFDLEDDGPEPARAYADEWSQWWSSARPKMSQTQKHRCGRPMSPGALVADLRRPGNTARDLTVLELQIRYRCPATIQPYARHAVQSAQLDALDTWALESDAKFPPGAACFAGKSR
jgi:hypothetical protein